MNTSQTVSQAADLNAMEFFEQSAGQWRSQRTTHHLPFRRAETGGSSIQVQPLPPSDPRIAEICTMHSIDPALAIGGASVVWQGTMEWDRDEENHEGSTIFALVPDEGSNGRSGKLLRDQGYAEIVPVVGQFHLDDENGLVLTTEYETMSSVERFWFAGPNMRLRSSTVQRFGGLSTASFCAETRIAEDAPAITDRPWDATPIYSSLGW
jgi:hypothetical protein